MKSSGDLYLKLLHMVHDHSFELSMQEKSECLWILANLACEPEGSYKLLAEYDAYSVVMKIF